MYDHVRALLSRHLPGYEVRSLTRIGAGLDNVAYEINGHLVVRLSKAAAADESCARELELLGAVRAVLSSSTELAPSTLSTPSTPSTGFTVSTPEPVFADTEHGALCYVKVPGVQLLDHAVAEPHRLAAPLGWFLTHLHGAAPSRFTDLVPRESDPLSLWRDDAEQHYRELPRRDTIVPAHGRRLIEEFLARTHPPEPLPTDATFCHYDLGAEHLLVDSATDALTGVIDWTDAAIGDPAVDLALLYRDLGPEVFELVVESYDRAFDAPARERVRFYARCALIEDLAYGVRTGDRRYRDAALAHLEPTFAD